MNKFLFKKIDLKNERIYNYQCEICKRIDQYCHEMRHKPLCVPDYMKLDGSCIGSMILLNVVIKPRSNNGNWNNQNRSEDQKP